VRGALRLRALDHRAPVHAGARALRHEPGAHRSAVVPGPGPVPAEPCALACVPSAAWDVVREWETDGGERTQISVPVVAHLEGALPEVVVSSGWQLDHTELEVWRGDGAAGYTLPGAFHDRGAEPASGDLDADGDQDLVALLGDDHVSWLQAMEADGTVLWQSEPFTQSHGNVFPVDPCEPVIADLEGTWRWRCWWDTCPSRAPPGSRSTASATGSGRAQARAGPSRTTV
jgi:hypothetical protein